MPGNEKVNTKPEPNSTAFEYVMGTLRGEGRTEFERQLIHSQALQAEVSYWTEHFMGLQNPAVQLAPKPQTWADINRRVQRTSPVLKTPESFLRWRELWRWALLGVMTMIMAVVLIGYYPQMTSQAPNTDYLAVLVDPDGKAVLTALTTIDGEQMWLKWEGYTLPEEASVQLWAVSKRDGETRPIAVFDETDIARVELSNASLRLVTDAEFLLLTEEEPGGSALDEPSDMIIAKGVCVRFTPPATKG